jgi:hypothetical protein
VADILSFPSKSTTRTAAIPQGNAGPATPAAQRGRTGPAGPLGTYTNTAAAPLPELDITDSETGEIHTFQRQEDGTLTEKFDPKKHRRERNQRKRAVRAILGPNHRTSKCLFVACSTSVQVLKDQQTGIARYSGLTICGRIWTCPVCAAKVSTRRAEELRLAVDRAADLGLKVALLTVTSRHTRGDPLKPLVGAQLKAWGAMTEHRQWKNLKAEMGVQGVIRNIEITRGENGWHPHMHALVFYRHDVDLQQIEKRFSELWQHCSVKVGLRRPSDDHGLTLQDGSHASKYVSKWGVEHEMTKAHLKTARKHGRTPFQILQDYADKIDQNLNAQLFQEYAEAMFRKQQLYWSQGLKKLLAVADKTDEEVAAEEGERPTHHLLDISNGDWRCVRWLHDLTILEMAESTPDQLREFVRIEAAKWRVKHCESGVTVTSLQYPPIGQKTI